MTWKMNRKNSIYIQLLRLLIAAAFAALAFFFAINLAGEHLIDAYLEKTDYIEKKNQAYAKKLRKYVKKEGLSTRDIDKLNAWTRKQQILFVCVYKDDILVFDSQYPEQELWEENIAAENYDWESYYFIDFEDGTAEVTIMGAYDYQIRNYVVTGEIGLAFVFFLGFVLLGIRRRIDYIRKLSEEIEILEGGNLEYEITVKGKDELAGLAEGLDSMRISFRSLIRQEAEMARENQRIVTELSHDLRTPITSILLYTEILKKGKYENSGQIREYLDKIEQKAHRMKQLTDHLFEYSLVAGEKEIQLEEPKPCEDLFYDLFSDTCSYLEQRGFQVDFRVEWSERSLRISTDYVMRILDNITSNLVKYAEPSASVVISSVEKGNLVGFCFQNRIRRLEEKPESTGIGIQNIRNMMQKMGGECTVKKEGEVFELILLFPRVH